MGQVVAFKHGGVVKRTAVPEQTHLLTQPAREVDWAALLQRLVGGDHATLAELYDASSNVVFGLALRILGERSAAEDAMVEVYTQVWAQAKSYDPQRGTPLSWLLTVTRSRAIDLARVRGRNQAAEPIETIENVPSASPGPEETSVVGERRRVVCQALESLSADQRQVIELAYFSGLSHTEIAAKLEQPLGTVKTRIRMGLMRLRELLGPLAPPTAAVN
jgi:RNA polymerase sigma-70 factor, ECF subfamily